MITSDFISIIQWWSVIFFLGIIFLPLSSIIFARFSDLGYSFSKVISIAIISYSIFLLATIKILPFSTISIIFLLTLSIAFNFWLLKKKSLFKNLKKTWRIFVFEEVLFLLCLAIWSFIRSHEPSINGLEKFMDFGFLNSILRTTYLPATDMWFTPLSINYYYFGHFITAVLTKLSYLPSSITYNLMIATLFSFTFTLSFSLVLNFVAKNQINRRALIGGLLAGLLAATAGNLHTIYSLFASYNVDAPVPFWMLSFLPDAFPNSYWYPNATRFIVLTIHEFPLYSFVVSDLHGHVIDIIFVLTGIALIYVLFLNKITSRPLLILLSFLIAIMYMTNAWDGLIYLLLASVMLTIKNIPLIELYKNKKTKLLFLKFQKIKSFKNYIFDTIKNISLLGIFFIIFTLPFNLFFKPFASGIGIICAPDFLVKMEKVGPFIFEADHCQSTPWWQFIILYGFFYFFVFSFLIFLIRRAKEKITTQDIFVLIMIFVSTLLIAIPEFVYVKDIYPAHYRANTMFKLVYQAFIMLSLSSAYIIVIIIKTTRNIPFYIATALLLGTVLIYPYFAVNSYYGNLKQYVGLDGISYLQTRHPDDFSAINWLNKNIEKQPTIVEAVGDSYTDYARISANTGLPTILGWTVHEWLWRGTYDIPAPRIEDVRLIYESPDANQTKILLQKYNVEYVYIGRLEREKYPQINEAKFNNLGEIIFQEGEARIIKLY